MPRIKRTDVHRFKRYLRSLIEEAVRTQCDGITSDEVSEFIQERLKNDVKNRVNALLAIGSEVGMVNKKDEGRYVLKKGSKQLEKTLDKCYKPKKFCPPPIPCCKNPCSSGSSSGNESGGGGKSGEGGGGERGCKPKGKKRQNAPPPKRAIRKKPEKPNNNGGCKLGCHPCPEPPESPTNLCPRELGSPKCCKRIKRYAHRKQRRLPGYREEICENYYSGSEA